MPSLSLLSDTELLARVPAMVQVERIARADVVEHLERYRVEFTANAVLRAKIEQARAD